MANKAPQQAPEVFVEAGPNDSWATVKWKFVRHNIVHNFSMQVFAQGAPIIKDNELRLTIPSGKRYSGEAMPGVPDHLATVHKANGAEYRDMVEGVVAILVKHVLILAAQTDPTGKASVRDPDFKYPKWHHAKSKAAYDPRLLRQALLTTSSLMRPKRAVVGIAPLPNGHAQQELQLQAPGTVLDIIQRNMPPQQDLYVDGVTDLVERIEDMRTEVITSTGALTNPDMVKIYNGYAEVLSNVIAMGKRLIDNRKREIGAAPAEVHDQA